MLKKPELRRFNIALILLFVLLLLSNFTLSKTLHGDDKDDFSLIRKKEGKKESSKKKKKSKYLKHSKKEESFLPSNTDLKISICLKKLMEDPGDEFLVSEFLELIKEKNGNFENEMEAFVKSIDNGNEALKFKIAMAHIYLKVGFPERSFEILSSIEKIPAPLKVVFFYLKGLSELSTERILQAEKTFEEILLYCEDAKSFTREGCIRACNEMIELSGKTGQVQSGSMCFLNVVKRTGILGELFEKIFKIYSDLKNSEETIKFLESVLRIYHWSGNEKFYLHLLLAKLFFKEGVSDGAMINAEKAIHLPPQSIESCNDVVDIFFDSAIEEEKLWQEIPRLMVSKIQSCVFLRLGERVEEIAGHSEALLIYERGLKLFPLNEELIVRYAKTLSDAGKAVEAEKFLLKKLKKVTSPAIAIQLGKVIMENGEYKEVREKINKISKSIKEVWFHSALEEYFDGAGYPELAEDENRILTLIDNHNPQHFISLGERLYNKQDIQGAKAVWQKIIGLYPDAMSGKSALAEIFLNHKMNKEAGEIIGSILQEKKISKQVSSQIASFYQSIDNPNEAEKWWLKVLYSKESEFSDKYEAAMRLIQIWKKMGALKIKEEELKKSIIDDPRDVFSGIFLAEVLFEENDWGGCEKVASEILSSDELKEEEALTAFSILERAVGMRPDLRPIDKKLVENIANRFPALRVELLMKVASIFIRQSNFPEAKRYVKMALEKSPDDYILNEKASSFFISIGEWKDAVDCLRKIIHQNPQNSLASLELGKALLNLGQKEEAIEVLEGVAGMTNDSFASDKALSLLMALYREGESNTILEKNLFNLYKKSRNKKVLRELIGIYSLMTEKGKNLEAGAISEVISEEEKMLPLHSATDDNSLYSSAGWIERARFISSTVILKGPDDLRLRAAEIFQQLADSNSVKVLLQKAFKNNNPEIKILALLSSTRINSNDPEIANIYRTLMNDKNKEVKMVSIIASAFSGFEEAGEKCIGFFDSADIFERASSMLAAGFYISKCKYCLYADKIKGELHSLFASKQFGLTYASSVIGLAATGGEKSLEILFNLYEKIQNERIGASVIENKPANVVLKAILMAIGGGNFNVEKVIPFLVKQTLFSTEDIADVSSYALVMAMKRKLNQSSGILWPNMNVLPLASLDSTINFNIMRLFESWCKLPDYKLTSNEFVILLPYVDKVLSEETEGFGNRMRASTSFERIFNLLNSMIDIGGGVALNPLTSHINRVETEIIRGQLKEIYRHYFQAISNILEITFKSNDRLRNEIILRSIELLSYLNETSSPPEILIDIVMKNPESKEGLLAIKGIGLFNNPISVKVLQDTLTICDWKGRLAVVESLSQMKLQEACQLLGAIALKDTSKIVSDSASKAHKICSAKWTNPQILP